MRLTDYAIRHRLTVYVLIVLIAVAGVGAYSSLPVESFPEIKIPLILVFTSYSGVSPEDMESLVTRRIETEIRGITGIKEISSTSSEGFSSIAVEFTPEVDLDTALQKVREKVDRAKSQLPPDIDDDPRVQDIDVTQIPVIVVTLSGEVGLVQLKEIAEDLKDDIEAITGVNRVEIIGGREREVHVFVDPRRLSYYELSLNDVVDAVARENLTMPGGEIDVGQLKYLVRVPAEIEQPREIENFVVKVRNGVPVHVRDVARVAYGFEDETSRSRLNRQPAVSLTVEKRTGVNIIGVTDAVKAELARLKERMPAGVNVTLVGDQSIEIRNIVSELENNIIAGLLLVVAVLMAFLGLRNSIFVGVAIPLSMLITFAVIQALGYTLNMIVLFSLILVVGMLVDNAIVIVENIYRHREEGMDGPSAASRATAEVAMPVIASTLTTVLAFAPLMFWPGIVGEVMSYLPITVIIGLSASLVVALIFNPTLCAYFMKAPTPRSNGEVHHEGRFLKRYRKLLAWILDQAADHGSAGWFTRNWLLMTAFGVFLASGMTFGMIAFVIAKHAATLEKIAATFILLSLLAFLAQGVWWLAAAIASRFASRCLVCLSDRRAGIIWGMSAVLVASVVLYGVLGSGVEFFPEMDPSEIWVDVETPSGSNIETSDEIVRAIEERTKDTPDLENAIANVGSLGVSINDISVGGSVGTQSRVTLDLVEHKHRARSSRRTLEESRIKLADLSGAEIKVDKPEQGPPTGKPVTVRVIGDDFRVLGRLSREIQRGIRKVPGLVNLDDDFDEGKPEVRIQVRRVNAAVAGVNTRAIASTVQTAIRGNEVSTYRIGEDEYDIRVRLTPKSRVSVEELGNLTVPDEDGVPIPIRTLADIRTGVGPAAIRRIDLKRVVTIEGDVVRARGRTEDSVRADVQRILDAMEWPGGYRWEFAGSNQEEDEAQQFLQRAFVVALLLIALVLVTQFDSLILPVTILLSIVLSLIGVFWGLILTVTPFGIIMTGIGVISLAGIVVNNAIVLCDFVVQLRRRGMSKTEAVIEAGAIRMRPVLLTAVTTVLGLIPLTAGINIGFLQGTIELGADSSKFWGPMGVAVIAGLTVATILTLIVVPVTYHSLEEVPAMAMRHGMRFIKRRRYGDSLKNDK
ncbi:MAG: efflux RND transporter permease subunit [Vicinamibacteria bacterium]|nr:efflux RND transporter permease subunit [Vicinamibacteria bacterium]